LRSAIKRLDPTVSGGLWVLPNRLNNNKYKLIDILRVCVCVCMYVCVIKMNVRVNL